jgi:predicted RNase H-like HicB family nuclease
MSDQLKTIGAGYAVCLIPDEEAGGYTVTVPDLPGCISEGDTEEEALANIREAMQAYIESLLKRGRPVPPPRTVTRRVPVPECALAVTAK